MKKRTETISPVEIQCTAIIGLMGDNELGETLCLKGGNALALVYKVSDRFSQDIDFSMAGDFDDREKTEGKIEEVLQEEFLKKGYRAFDVKLRERPKKTRDAKWGGYSLTFKVIAKDTTEELSDLGAWRRNAIQIGSDGGAREKKGKVEIDISKYEYTDSHSYETLDDVDVKVLSLPAILYEKIRAICQQMPEYSKRNSKKARARDFYDIYRICETLNIDHLSEDNLKHCRAIFEAKEVPKEFLLNIESQKAFHEPDWSSVTDTTEGQIEGFDYYFDFVCSLARDLHSHWDK